MSADPATIATTVIEHLERAWNAGDGAAFGAEFADETDFVNVRGEHHRGDGDLIGRAHQGLFDSIYAGSRVSYGLELARPLAPGLALAVVNATLEAPHGPMAGTHDARITLVIAEDDDRWAVTSFHNTLVTG
jgi:uncharacterized protein (TIGR02246 family)